MSHPSHDAERVGGIELESEFEQSPVPASHRKRLSSVAAVWFGFPMILTNAVPGGVVVALLGFWRGVAAITVANIVMLVYVGLLSHRAGSTGPQLRAAGDADLRPRRLHRSRRASWRRSSSAGSRSTPARPARRSTPSFGWNQTPVILGAGALFIAITFVGIRALSILGAIAAPLFVVVAIIALVIVARRPRPRRDLLLRRASAARAAGSLSFGAAVSLIMATFADSGTMTADFTRWSRNGREAVLAAFTAFPVASMVAQLTGGVIVAAGAIAAPATDGGNFLPLLADGAGPLLSALAIVFVFVNLGSVCSHCLYNGAVSWSSIVGGRMRMLTLLLGVAGVGIALAGVWSHFLSWLVILSVFVPPIGAVLIADQVLLRGAARVADRRRRPPDRVRRLGGRRRVRRARPLRGAAVVRRRRRPRHRRGRLPRDRGGRRAEPRTAVAPHRPTRWEPSDRIPAALHGGRPRRGGPRAARSPPVEVVEAVHRRMDRLEPRLHAFCHRADAGGARRGPRARARARGRRRPAVRCAACRSGSRTWSPSPGCRCPAARPPTATSCPTRTTSSSSVCARRGAIVLGKTAVPEFGYSGASHSPVGETTRNPWNLARTSGGSSAGSGAAVAAGIGPVAIAADGGGSIRIPASLLRAVRDEGVDGPRADVPVLPRRALPRDRELGGPRARRPGQPHRRRLGARPVGHRRARPARPPLDPGGRRRLAAPPAPATCAACASPSAPTSAASRSTRRSRGSWPRRPARSPTSAARSSAADPGFPDPGAAFAALIALESDLRGMREIVDRHGHEMSPHLSTCSTRRGRAEDFTDAPDDPQGGRQRDVAVHARATTCSLTPTLTTCRRSRSTCRARSASAAATSATRRGCRSRYPFNLTGQPAATVPAGFTRRRAAGRAADRRRPPRRRPRAARGRGVRGRARPWAHHRPPLAGEVAA